MNETEPNLETKAAEVKPEAKAVEPKPQASAAEPKLDTKAAEPAPAAKAAKPKPEFRNKIIFTLSILGVLAALVAAYLFGVQRKAQPPVFKPVSNPYDSAIYANGIIESDQASGENINVFPEVSGPITQVLAREGQPVTAGAPLFTIDDSVQRATTGQIRAQSDAALALLDELKAQPRPETLAVTKAQVDLAEASLKAARDQSDKDRASYDMDPKSISKIVLDTAEDAANQAAAALDVARKQYELTKAGAWSYDITNQAKQCEALQQAYQAANALLVKYSVKAPTNGVVLAVNCGVGQLCVFARSLQSHYPVVRPVSHHGSDLKTIWKCAAMWTRSWSPNCPPPGISARRCRSAGPTPTRCRWNSSGCSLMSRPRSSCRTSARSKWTCGCCR